MIPLGLTARERRLFESTLLSTHLMRTRIRLQNLDGDDLSDLSTRLLDGQVNIDTTAATTRQCSLTLDDPNHTLNLDSDAPGDGALYADRMIRADCGVYVPALTRWVNVPTFTGPIATMSRNGASVQLGCLGKEHLAFGQAWRPLTLRKGMNTVDAIRTILRERAGERRFSFPNLRHRLPKTVSLGRMSSPWGVAQQLARSLGRQLYYDGAGVCRLRTRPRGAVFTFRDGNGTVLSDAQITYDLGTIINTIWVKGGKPKGKKQAVTAAVTAPRSHPLSPWRLGRNDEPRYLVEEVDNDHVRSSKDARALARRTLDSRLLEGVTTTFDALPVPHLDPLDVVRLATDETSITFVLNQASLPLVHSGVMSVGTVRRVTPAKGRIR